MQSLILLSLIFWSLLNPTINLWLIITIGLGIAISSATQDITIDALRIEQIQENENKAMAAGAAIQVVGWWTGFKIGGVISLMSAEFFQQKDLKLLAIIFSYSWCNHLYIKYNLLFVLKKVQNLEHQYKKRMRQDF